MGTGSMESKDRGPEAVRKPASHCGPNLVGLILAAGYSSRMGAFKPLLPIGDVTALERISATLKGAGVHRIIGVTGYQRELLAPVLEAEGIEEAYNPDFDKGMFTSIQAGIRKALGRPSGETASKDSASEVPVSKSPAPENPAAAGGLKTRPDGFFLMLVDCPLVPSWVLEQLLKKQEEEPEAFLVPCFRGKKGHPLFIPGSYAEEILAYDGEGGLKAITNRHEDRLIRLETGTEAVVLDMDTQEGYEEILEYYGRQKDLDGNPAADIPEGVDPPWEELLRGKRLFLIRHGEIRQHKEKIFLGQTDIPLSDRGREQARQTAAEMDRLGVGIRRIYTSDLSRAYETAKIISRTMTADPVSGEKAEAQREVIPLKLFREMSLGEWDGRYISEIRERYPEEYRKRGEQLLTYKFGNDSENFYDLKYRAMKGLQSVLRQEREAGDSCRDIVIVSHSGVINVILSELKQKELSEQIGKRIPNGGMVLIDYSD